MTVQESKLAGNCLLISISQPLSRTHDRANWVTWDLDDSRMRPRGRDGRRLLSNLIYSGARCLDVIVAGEALRRDGETLTLDEDAAGSKLEEAVSEYYSEI